MNVNSKKDLSKERKKIPEGSTLREKCLFRKLKIYKLKFQFYRIVNAIIFYEILILLPKQILSNYINIKVNQPGTQQVLSDGFNNLPSSVYVNDIQTNLNDKKIQINSISSIIKLVWNNKMSNFSYMFNNLKNITEVNITNLIGINSTFYFTFSNCTNLKNISIDIEYKIEQAIKNMSGMFYNCQSLTSFSFQNLYLDYHYSYTYKRYDWEVWCGYLYGCGSDYDYNSYHMVTDYYYNKINMSYMFYNCSNLISIISDSRFAKYISDMNYMFYNCNSLNFINLEKFLTTDELDIDLSYMFYNCNSLTSIKFNENSFKVKDTKYMFYNCNSLTYINLGQISTLSPYIDLSYMFYNCYSLTSISFPSSINVNNMKYMFYNCSNLDKINLESFNQLSSSYFDFSYLFYNCQSLKSIKTTNNNFQVTDIREMFYNCTTLIYVQLNLIQKNDSINMTNMFYNCRQLKNITLIKGNSYFIPNDMPFMFYNCNSLTSLDFNKFNTSKVKSMSYMLYNCTNLIYFDTAKNIFENTEVKDMRGLFQNCESIVTLNLTTFYTPNVEIMWDMFNGCSHLINLYITNFNTSNVIDMTSMFSGCKSLVSLNLNHFNTTNVQYMNEMFQNCEKLEQLNMSQLTSDSMSSMYRMFFNCKSLKYLNIFNLKEDFQSITEMFNETSDNFIICIKEEENIPNIYELISDKITRDCSSDCYGIENERNSTQNKKSCCASYEFNNTCYNNCPSKTKAQNSTNICEYFTCNNSYYNYEQNNCTDNITEGFYVNDTYLNTIDKCHEDCKTCYNGSDEYSTNCLTCNDNESYVYLGNCYTSCRYGYFNESDGIKKCLCHRTKCKECTRDSLKYDLCVSCNEEEGYYEKSNDIIDIMKNLMILLIFQILKIVIKNQKDII